MTRIFLILYFFFYSIPCFPNTEKERMTLSLDFSEAEKVLAVLEKQQKGEKIPDAEWLELFSTTPYKELKKRETSFKSGFSDEAFKTFVQSKELGNQTLLLSQTLNRWKTISIEKTGKEVFKYLPSQATIKAKVCIVIKPGKNSFVWGQGDTAMLFLYLNPALSKKQFKNKLVHELHHIGINSLESKLDSIIAPLETKCGDAVKWLGGFGEGEAILAAAGSAHTHPHKYDGRAAISQWDSDMKDFNRNLDSLQKFFLKILGGQFKDETEIEDAAETFYGAQGAFYTVGYGMASLVEKTFGRKALVDGYIDPRNLLVLYNKAVDINKSEEYRYTKWSPDFINMLGASK